MKNTNAPAVKREAEEDWANRRGGERRKKVGGALMRRKGLERRSKKYAPVQDVSVVNWYMDAKDFHRKYKTSRVRVKERMSPATGGKNRIMIFGPGGQARRNNCW